MNSHELTTLSDHRVDRASRWPQSYRAAWHGPRRKDQKGKTLSASLQLRRRPISQPRTRTSSLPSSTRTSLLSGTRRGARDLRHGDDGEPVSEATRLLAARPKVRRQIANDIQGYISEMLAKAVNQNALKRRLDEEDRNRLFCLLKNFGDLGENDICSTCGKTKCKNCNAELSGVRQLRQGMHDVFRIQRLDSRWLPDHCLRALRTGRPSSR